MLYSGLKVKTGFGWVGSGLGCISLAHFLQHFIFWVSHGIGIAGISMIALQLINGGQCLKIYVAIKLRDIVTGSLSSCLKFIS